LYAYSFSNIVCTVNGAIITNFGAGDDVITVEPLTDAATTQVGADGHLVASISANRGCKVTLHLQQTSPSNYILQQLYNLQIAMSAQFQPISMAIQDAMKQDSCTCTGGIIVGQAHWVRGANATDMEWVIDFERYTVVAGIQTELSGIASNVVMGGGITGAVGGVIGGITGGIGGGIGF
jgi:hypothetical protein